MCSGNEVLRRLYASKTDRFHEVNVRARAMIRLKQEWKVRDLAGYARLDTTALTLDEVTAQIIAFWQSAETE